MSSNPDQASDAARALPLPDCGQRISVETPRHDGKLWTHMIGFKPGRYLVLEKPPGADAVDGPSALRDGDSLVIRFLKDGSIFGFRAPVLGSLSMPYKLLFVACPVDVVRHSLRSSPRLQCYLPCDGRVGGRLFSRAFIRDFSATGCQLRIPLEAVAEEQDEDGSELAPDETQSTPENDGAEVPPGEPKAELSPELAAGAELEAPAGAEPEAPAGAELEAPAGAELEAPAGAELEVSETDPGDSKKISLNMHLPGEDEMRVAAGEVLEWQSMPRYHLLRVNFDEPQNEIFEQLCLYTTQLG
jgi:hypothetical protein